jgi:predicted transposase/invertase (TIGR01784 family)
MELSSKWDYWAKVQEDMHERDRENELRFALKEALEQGKKQGISQGISQGRKEGKTEGKTEGIDIGEKRAMRQIAHNMKASGMPVSQIAQLSGLSSDEIEKL